MLYLHPQKQGTLAQMVEQWTENPCVPGSIPGGTTEPDKKLSGFLLHKYYPCRLNSLKKMAVAFATFKLSVF